MEHGKKKKDEGKKISRRRPRNPLLTKRNTERRIQREARRVARKREKLLQRHRDGRPGGIRAGGERDQRLRTYIESLHARE